jgi:glycosyltransferase involved in cell wall biosynthesis
MIKVALIIRSLDRGGAERQAVTLAKVLDKKRFDTTILTFYPGGALERELDGNGVRLISLGKRGRWDLPAFLGRLTYHLRRLRPDVIHSYLDIPNLLAVCARPFCGRPAVIWGCRSSKADLDNYDWLRRSGSSLERKLAQFPDRIVVNSHAGLHHLLSQGFPAQKLVLIHNGFDTEQFHPDGEARNKVRREWGIANDKILVGLVARFDPIKDYETFLRAASLVNNTRPDVRFVCVGNGPEDYWKRLKQLSERLALAEKISWVGMRADMSDVYNAFDINVSSSTSEGFPNVVGEAMACGVPCVVTDAGDSALLVGDTGFVSPCQDPQALATNLISCIESDRKYLGLKARRRIEENWNVGRLAEETEKVILSLQENGTPRPLPLFTLTS